MLKLIVYSGHLVECLILAHLTAQIMYITSMDIAFYGKMALFSAVMPIELGLGARARAKARA